MKLRVYDSNIRLHAVAKDFQKYERDWTDRRHEQIAAIKAQTANVENALVCMQEVLYDQLSDIKQGLKPDWTYVGYGRDDGQQEGEFAPIFYRSAEWTLKNSKVTWLSDTPDRPSYGWGAHIKRIVTYAELENVSTKQTVHVFNTHFDHETLLARTESAKLIVGLAAAKNGQPVIITGDFNATPDENCYSTMSTTFLDASKATSTKNIGPTDTYIGFDYETEKDNNIIDYVWINDKLSVSRYEVVDPLYTTGDEPKLRFTDHRILVVDLETK